MFATLNISARSLFFVVQSILLPKEALIELKNCQITLCLQSEKSHHLYRIDTFGVMRKTFDSHF